MVIEGHRLWHSKARIAYISGQYSVLDLPGSVRVRCKWTSKFCNFLYPPWIDALSQGDSVRISRRIL